MKSFAIRQFDRLARRVGKHVLANLRGVDGYNLLEAAKLKAAFDSATYYEAYLLQSKTMPTDLALLSYAIDLAAAEGLILEFGVASGRTINHLAAAAAGRDIFGFDSFDGLPEIWRSGFDKGQFAQKMPSVRDNVRLIKGLFDETLPAFLEEHDGKIAFLHVDCDLYSSTQTILSLLQDRLVSGSVIVFDEYWNYPGWEQHEYKAFQEFTRDKQRSYDYKAFVPSHQQVCVVLR